MYNLISGTWESDSYGHTKLKQFEDLSSKKRNELEIVFQITKNPPNFKFLPQKTYQKLLHWTQGVVCDETDSPH